MPVGGQIKPKTRTVLFGVKLSKQATRLLADVENQFKKHVREEWLDPYDEEWGGKSLVDEDGTPVIRLNPIHGKSNDVIIHELFHFKLRAVGYPTLLWKFPPSWNTETNRNALTQLAMQLHDPVLHYIFYPQIRGMGLDPFIQRTPAERALKDKEFLARMDTGAVALFYFKIRLETGREEPLLRRLESAFEGTPNSAGVELGKRLSRLVVDANPKTPEDDARTFVSCLNVFYEGRFHFKQHPFTTRQLGNFTERIAVIEIGPAG